MTPGARLQAAIDILDIIDTEAASADDIIRAYFRARRYAGSKDRRNVREAVYDVLRHRARLDWWIAGAAGEMEPSNRLRAMADLALAGTDPAPLFGQAPHAPDTLSEEETAMVTNLTGQSLDHDAQAPVARLELPHWLDDSLRTAWGDTFEDEAKALGEPGSVDLRANIARVSRDQAAKALRRENIIALPTEHSPLGLRLEERADITKTETFKKGLVEIQDEGSQLVTLLTGTKPGDAVCDFCAGAGGKTLALADMAGLQGGQSGGRLAACDNNKRRLGRIEERLARAKLSDVVERHALIKDDPWLADNAEAFDVVLVDAPCSGSGNWRRHPEAKWRLTPEELTRLTVLQDSILDTASALVKPGGRLVYVTCSYLPEENEQRAAAFLERQSNFASLSGGKVWADTLKTPCPVPGETLRFSPLSTATDGFFCAIFSR